MAEGAVVGHVLQAYAAEKATSAALDRTIGPVIDRVLERIGMKTAGTQLADLQMVAEKYGLEIERGVAFAEMLNARILVLEAESRGGTDDLRRRAAAPSYRTLAYLATDAALDAPREEAHALLAELLAQRLLVEEDTTEARSLLRATELAKSLSTNDLLLLGGIVAVVEPGAFPESVATLVKSRDWTALGDFYEKALPKLFKGDITFDRMADLEAYGAITRNERQRAGEFFKAASPIQQLVFQVVGAIPPHSTEPLRDFIPGMPPGSPLYRAARLAVPSDDGVRASATQPALVNYWLTSPAKILAQIILERVLAVRVQVP